MKSKLILTLNLFNKKLFPFNPWKAISIKEEVEKMVYDGYIYPIPLIELVSNLVPLTKK
jgi:hypothetical protein